MAWIVSFSEIHGARRSAAATAAHGDSTKRCSGSWASKAKATSSMIAPGAS